MSDDGLARLTRACATVSAPGTDPELVAVVIGWAVRPRRSLDALRRHLAATPADQEPGVRLRRAVGAQLDQDDLRHARAPVASWAQRGCVLSVVGDPGYPRRLAEGWPDTDGPVLLATAGAPPADRPTVAVVGSRRASSYGRGVTSWLAEAAGHAGAHVVSGGAIGIDAAAHRAALATVGGTSVVLGCGHNVDYPRGHARAGGLFEDIRAQGGGVLSEQFPDVAPRAGVVRARNRIVAGLADVVVVVEGGDRSGALLTATAALERGRTVLAVPGDVRASGSVAPNRLLGEGAHPCTGPEDLLDAMASASPSPPSIPATTARLDARASSQQLDAGDAAAIVTVLPRAVHAVLAAAWPRAVPVDVLLERAGVGAGAVLAALTRAQIAGEISEGPEGVVLQRRPARAGGPPP